MIAKVKGFPILFYTRVVCSVRHIHQFQTTIGDGGSGVRGSSQQNLSRPTFSRLVPSPQLAVSNACNVPAGEQNFSREGSSISPSQGFFVSLDKLKGFVEKLA